jgi:hypothetical protein
MKKTTLFLFIFFTFQFGNAQTNLFFDNFESYNDFLIDGIGDWITLDLDGLQTYTGGVGSTLDPASYPNASDPMAFQIFNPSTTTPTAATNEADPAAGEVRNFDPFSGAKFVGSWAGVPAAPITANNDWLISPLVTLAASGNSLKLQVKALSTTYGDESYEIGVYVGSGIPTASADFTILGGTRTATYPNWEEVLLDLTAYDDMQVRIGIHYISSDVYLLMVDDLSIDTTLNLSVDAIASKSFDYNYNKSLESLILASTISPLNNIEVFDVLGKRIINLTLSGNSGTVNLSSLTDGIYIARVNTEKGTRTFKFVKN